MPFIIVLDTTGTTYTFYEKRDIKKKHKNRKEICNRQMKNLSCLPSGTDTRDGAGYSRDAVLGVHARTRNDGRKKKGRAKTNGENQELLERSGK